MYRTQEADGINFNSSSYWTKIQNSKWTDATLLTGAVALLVIGLMASSNVFNAIGTAQATYLSYGMYGGAALLSTLEIIKSVRSSCCKNQHVEEPGNKPVENRPKEFKRPVPAEYKSPLEKRSEPLSITTVHMLQQSATSFAAYNATPYFKQTMDDAINALETYINGVINDWEFQKDPVAYLEAWDEKRGGSQEHRVIEDTARKFFDDNEGLFQKIA